VDALAQSWSKAEPSVQDVPILDELRVMLGSPPRGSRPRREDEDDQYGELSTVSDRRLAERTRPTRDDHYDEYAHLVVDEAQDLSPMQWRLLGRRGKYASWTIVGDPAQSSWEDRAEAKAAMDAALGRLARHVFTLSTNYRNPAEIFDLAARVARRAMPDAELPRAVRSTGAEPSVRAVGHGVEDAVCVAVDELLGQVEGMVGVITTMRGRDEARGWLAQRGRPPGERVQVVGSLEAKGMEYDGVVIVEPGHIAAESPTGVRALYVALTRATQRLITVAADNDWLPPDVGP
jgi:DNA helicase IV